MGHIKLHEKVEEFKQFVENKPKIKEAVKNKEYSWQQLFNIWRDRGPDDPFWDDFKEKEKSDSININKKINKFIDALANIDPDKLDQQVKSLSRAIDHFQKLVSEYQKTPQQNKRRPF